MNTTRTIDRAALVTVAGGQRLTTPPTDWRPCETSPRYDEWLRTHPLKPGGR
jgi:hypothetical protein